MSKLFKFQDPGEGIHEAEVLRVLVSPNDEVKEGQDVFEVETDKANFDVSCPYDGTVKEIHVQEGDRIQVGDPLMRIAEAGAQSDQHDGTGDEQKEDDQNQAAQDEAEQQEARSSKEDEQEESSDDQDGAAKKEPSKKKPVTEKDSSETGKDTKEKKEETADQDEDETTEQDDDDETGEKDEETSDDSEDDSDKEKGKKPKQDKKKKHADQSSKEEQEEQYNGPSAGSTKTQQDSNEKQSSSRSQEPVAASPATRRVARELNVDLHEVTPRGEGGRVLTTDVRAFAESRESQGGKHKEKSKKKGEEERKERAADKTGTPSLPDFAKWGPIERKPMRSIRRETAKRMTLSWSHIPHVTHNDVADITELEHFRQRHVDDIAAKGGKLTLTVLIMKAVVGALHEFPSFNASLDPEAEEIILKSYYHLGVALDSERGLLVPVIRDVDRKSVSELSKELFELSERVRKGNVNREDMTGATFTITNPGPIGGTTFTPIINFPEVAILGLGRARLQPIIQGSMDHPDIVPRLMLPLSLAFDHRANDGALAARFVNRIIQALTDLETFTLTV